MPRRGLILVVRVPPTVDLECPECLMSRSAMVVRLLRCVDLSLLSAICVLPVRVFVLSLSAMLLMCEMACLSRFLQMRLTRLMLRVWHESACFLKARTVLSSSSIAWLLTGSGLV